MRCSCCSLCGTLGQFFWPSRRHRHRLRQRRRLRFQLSSEYVTFFKCCLSSSWRTKAATSTKSASRSRSCRSRCHLRRSTSGCISALGQRADMPQAGSAKLWLTHTKTVLATPSMTTADGVTIPVDQRASACSAARSGCPLWLPDLAAVVVAAHVLTPVQSYFANIHSKRQMKPLPLLLCCCSLKSSRQAKSGQVMSLSFTQSPLVDAAAAAAAASNPNQTLLRLVENCENFLCGPAGSWLGSPCLDLAFC